jgi:dCMP deaminase
MKNYIQRYTMTPKENRYHTFYMDVAKRAAEMSYAEKRKVGAVIVKEGNILSYGWNGTPSGFDNCCEDTLNDGTTKTKATVIHSEMNAILKLAKGTESGKGSSLYCTLSPCMDCAKAIQGSGIKEVFYEQEYRDKSGIDFLNKCGISINKL